MVKITRPYIFLFLAAATLLGQTRAAQTATKPATRRPSVTHIGKHRLGETFDGWLVLEKIDASSSTDESLTKIRQTGRGEVSGDIGNFTWTFLDSKLQSANILFDPEKEAHQMAFLRETYGLPSHIGEIPIKTGSAQGGETPSRYGTCPTNNHHTACEAWSSRSLRRCEL